MTKTNATVRVINNLGFFFIQRKIFFKNLIMKMQTQVYLLTNFKKSVFTTNICRKITSNEI